MCHLIGQSECWIPSLMCLQASICFLCLFFFFLLWGEQLISGVNCSGNEHKAPGTAGWLSGSDRNDWSKTGVREAGSHLIDHFTANISHFSERGRAQCRCWGQIWRWGFFLEILHYIITHSSLFFWQRGIFLDEEEETASESRILSRCRDWSEGTNTAVNRGQGGGEWGGDGGLSDQTAKEQNQMSEIREWRIPLPQHKPCQCCGARIPRETICVFIASIFPAF